MEEMNWVIQALKAITSGPYKRKAEGDITLLEKKVYKDGGRGWRDATASQGTLAATGSWKRHRVDFPLEPLRE